VLDQRGAEQSRSGSRIEDPGVAREEANANRSDRPRREIVVRPGELVVVDRGDAVVLGSQLVEVARAVQAVDVDPPLADR
jgi:hypothetical protein